MLELKEANIARKIKKGNILLMFYTEWCPLCPPIIEILRGLEAEENGLFRFMKINFDQNPKAAAKYGAFGVPLVLAVKNGKILEGWAGLTEREGYRKIIAEKFGDEK